MCERKMLCKVQNSIAASCTIVLGIFGMKSTFRLKEDFFYLVFFSLEEKKCRRRHICKKRTCRLAVGGCCWPFFKEGTSHYPGKNRNLSCKKKSKDKNVKTFRPWAIKRCRGLSSFTYNDTFLQFHCSAKYNVLPNWVNPHKKRIPGKIPC